MPHTFAEKALTRASQLDSVQAGDFVDVQPDFVFSHDNSAAIRRIFDQIGAPSVVSPDRIGITLDHAAPAPTTQHAQNHAEIRKFVEEQGIQHFFEVGRGICHQVFSEEALILPGELIVGADSHTPHFGWLGAFGAGLGRSEIAALWATGTIWMRVPEAIQIGLTGALEPGVTAKDIALEILKHIGADGALYRSVEFTGDTIATLSTDERAVLPNMMAEAGAKNAYMPPDEVIFEYLEAKRTRDYTALYPDANASYAERLEIKVNELEPQISLPHNPANVVPLSEAVGVPVQQAFIGTCTNGRYEDLEAAARILDGQKIAVRLVVVPASSQVMLKAAQTGVLATLLEAGATVSTPGCGPCMGNHMGVPAPDEVTISSANRNFNGRMGTRNAPTYLSSPYVVAASAVTGVITSPYDFLAGCSTQESTH